METQCHNCKFKDDPDRLERCLKCRKAEDESYHGKVVHLCGRDVAYHAPTGPRYVLARRGISHDIEDTLREAMCTLFSLDGVEFLLLQHLLRGDALDTFAKRLADFARRTARYRGSQRAQAFAMKETVGRKIPVLAPILGVCGKTADVEASGGDGIGERVGAFMREVFGRLDAVEVLLVRHIVNHGALSSFHYALRRVRDTIGIYTANPTELVHVRHALRSKLPSVSTVIGEAFAEMVRARLDEDNAPQEDAPCTTA